MVVELSMVPSISTEQGVSRETFEKLRTYNNLLIKWNQKINLVSPATIKSAWDRHFLDSLQLTKFVKNQDLWIDLGSGAGFPALVTSIYLNQYKPNLTTTLVESDARKCAFMRTVIRTVDAKAIVQQARIEDVTPTSYDIVSSRALAPLNQLFGYAGRLSHEETTCLFPKGKNWEKEVDDARRNWRFDIQAHKSLTEDEAVILEVRNVQRA